MLCAREAPGCAAVALSSLAGMLNTGHAQCVMSAAAGSGSHRQPHGLPSNQPGSQRHQENMSWINALNLMLHQPRPAERLA